MPCRDRCRRGSGFNPRPPRGGRRGCPAGLPCQRRVSIHAPHAGGDRASFGVSAGGLVSIHAPHAGGDGVHLDHLAGDFLFQSTPPTRGATRERRRCADVVRCFNPRPPRGGRQGAGVVALVQLLVSIHAPHAGGDDLGCRCRGRGFRFQSTPPTRGATLGIMAGSPYAPVSIHAPHAGGDPSPVTH